LKALPQKMYVLSDRSGKIVAVYIPDSSSKPGCPQIKLVTDEQKSAHEVEIPNDLVKARFDGAALSRYRVRIEGGQSKLVLRDPKKKS
jgi:hypothetical protein